MCSPLKGQTWSNETGDSGTTCTTAFTNLLQVTWEIEVPEGPLYGDLKASQDLLGFQVSIYL